jgi:hypothetical protein
MSNLNLFEEPKEEEDNRYTKKVSPVIYDIKGSSPDIIDLVNVQKTYSLIKEIDNAENITKEEREFLIFAAYRHLVFSYETIAEYYANASKEMQDLMEKSALVIIDFDKAIEYGYMKLGNELRNYYLEKMEE